MSLRYEQYSALKRSKDFISSLLFKETRPKNITEMKKQAYACLRHFPFLDEKGEPQWSQDPFTEDKLSDILKDKETPLSRAVLEQIGFRIVYNKEATIYVYEIHNSNITIIYSSKSGVLLEDINQEYLVELPAIDTKYKLETLISLLKSDESI